MDRRAFVSGVTLGLLAAPLAAEGQQATKIPRIGYLAQTSYSDETPFREAFLQGLRDVGYVEGQNIVIDYRYADGKLERLPGLADELVRLHVDIIIAVGGADVLAAKSATRTIPIVMVLAYDPVRWGLVASLARPGGNITGLTSGTYATKQLQLLKEAVPRLSRVAVLQNPANGFHPLAIKEIDAAADTLRLTLQILQVRSPDEFESAFAAMTKARVGALFVPGDGMFFLHRTRLAELAAKSHLPALYGLTDHARAGGLMAFSANFTDSYPRAALYVDKILKGAKPADLPIEQPTRFELIINLKTAKALGLTIPQSLLQRADEVIE